MPAAATRRPFRSSIATGTWRYSAMARALASPSLRSSGGSALTSSKKRRTAPGGSGTRSARGSRSVAAARRARARPRRSRTASAGKWASAAGGDGVLGIIGGVGREVSTGGKASFCCSTRMRSGSEGAPRTRGARGRGWTPCRSWGAQLGGSLRSGDRRPRVHEGVPRWARRGSSWSREARGKRITRRRGAPRARRRYASGSASNVHSHGE